MKCTLDNWSRNVGPRAPVLNFADGGLRNSVVQPDHSARLSGQNSSSYCRNIRIEKLAASIILSAHLFWVLAIVIVVSPHPKIVAFLSLLSISTLGVTVPVVIKGCSNEQMGWIAARRIIAAMTRQHTVRYGSIGNEPCKTMGIKVSLPYCMLPVSLWVSEPVPFPACVTTSASHSTPESCDLFFGEGNFLPSEKKGPNGWIRHIAKYNFVGCLAPFGSNELPYGASLCTLSKCSIQHQKHYGK